MGFDSRLVGLLMACVVSANYQIAHAGRNFGSIVPQRGIRQGDPLSSYLFLVCIEGFTALIHDYERRQSIKGIKVARTAPSISHMFFADDSFIFCKATTRNADSVLQMLKIFEKASGQQINVVKSSVFFSRNTNEEVKESLLFQLQFQEAGEHSLYLGLPSLMHRKKTAMFGFIKNRLQDRIEGWDKAVLSKGGKEILLKTVAQTLPNYAMSVFLLPIELCQDIERIMCRFWWRASRSKEKSIHWMSWERMSKKKSIGGLGFWCIRDFNLALLGKQSWRLINQPQLLVSRVYKSRYYSEGSFFTAKLGGNPSYVWRSIMETQALMKEGSVRRISNGENTFVLNEPWLPDMNPYVISVSEALINARVSSLMDTSAVQWDFDLIRDIFEDRDANLILSIPINSNEGDTWYWKFEKLGGYSVKSAYGHLGDSKDSNHSDDNFGFWRRLWNLKIPPKIKHFLWREVTGNLPTKDNLLCKRVQVDNWCPVCQSHTESILHSFVTCSFADECWNYIRLPVISGSFFSFAEWFKLVLQQYIRNDVHLTAMVCWMLWKNRNDLVWNQRSMQVGEVVESAKSVLDQWRSVQDKSFDIYLGYMTQDDGHEHWKLPQQNRIKVNTDAAIFESSTSYSYAFVARNHAGRLVEARSRCLQGKVSPEIAEAFGIREVLSWIKDTHRSEVEVEADCLQLVQAIRSSTKCFSYLGRVVEECQVLLDSLKARNVLIRFVKRSANKVSHYLARHSCSIADRVWRIGDVHSDFQRVLLNDLKN